MSRQTGYLRHRMNAIAILLLLTFSVLQATVPASAVDLQISDPPLPIIVDPENITVGNTADYETFISWTTEDPAKGWIIYGTTPDTLTNTAYDIRGSGANDTTHMCILNTIPSTDYYYRVVSNGTAYGHDGGGVILATPGFTWNFSSFAEISNPGLFPHIVEACVKYPNGTPANNVLATFYFKRGTAVTTLAIALSNELGTIRWSERLNGSARVSLNRLRWVNGSGYAPYKHPLPDGPINYDGDKIYFKLNGGHRGIYPASGWDSTYTVSGGEGTFVGNFTLIDDSAPVLMHTPPVSSVAYVPVNITVDASDITGVTGAVLYYKDGTSWSSTPMSLSSGTAVDGEWKAQITPTTVGGMQYYITATDGTYTSRTPRRSIDHYLMDILFPPVEQLEIFAPASTIAGAVSPITVNTLDQGGSQTNTPVTVTFTSTDIMAVLPSDYTFAAGDSGQKIFTFTLKGSGNQNITVSVLSDPTINATDNTTVEHGPLNHISVSPSVLSIGAGNSSTFTADGWDIYGNTFNITDDPDLNWTLWGGVGMIFQNGTFSALTVGAGLVNASIGSGSSIVGSADVGVFSGDPRSMTYIGGDFQNGEVNQTLSTSLSVRISDNFGNYVSGVFVAWSVSEHPGNSTGEFSQTLSMTDANGVATTSYRLGNVSGDYTVNASVSGLLGSPISFELTAIPGDPASMEIFGPGNATAGEFTELDIVVYDIFGNMNDTAVVEFNLSSSCADIIQSKFLDRCAGVSWINASITNHPNAGFNFSINITPAQVDIIRTAFTNHTMEAGANILLGTVGYDIYGNINTTWVPIWNTTLGSVNSDTFFAGNTAGETMVNVTLTGYQAKKQLNVTITPSALSSIQVHPNPLVIGIISSPRTIGAYGYDVYGNDISIVPVWDFSSPVGGIADGKFMPFVIGDAVLTASYGGLQGLASISVTDNIPPTVNSSINDSAIDVPIDASIRLFFSKDMSRQSVLENLSISDSTDQPVGYTTTWNGNNLTIRPDQDLGPGEEHVLILLNGVDTKGNTLGSLIFTFTTELIADMDKDGIPDHLDTDKDGDGMNDTWEDRKGLNSFDPSDAAMDTDDDGLSNLEEHDAGLDPNNPDSDGDGIPDGEDPSPLEPNVAKARSGVSILSILLIVLLVIIGINLAQAFKNRQQDGSGETYTGQDGVYEQGSLTGRQSIVEVVEVGSYQGTPEDASLGDETPEDAAPEDLS